MRYSKFRAYWTLTGAYMSLVMGIAAVCGAALSGGRTPSWVSVLLFFSQSALSAGCFALHDILDLRRDATNHDKPLVTGALSMLEARAIVALLLSTGLLASVALGVAPFLIAFAAAGSIMFYTRIKMRSGIAANLMTAGLCAAAFIFGASSRGHIGLAWIPALLTLQFNTAREIIKDVVDVEPDAGMDVPTVPRRYGLRVSAAAVTALVLLSVLTTMLPSVRHAFGVGYIVLMTAVDVLLLAIAARFAVRPDYRSAALFRTVSAAVFPLALLAFFL